MSTPKCLSGTIKLIWISHFPVEYYVILEIFKRSIFYIYSLEKIVLYKHFRVSPCTIEKCCLLKVIKHLLLHTSLLMLQCDLEFLLFSLPLPSIITIQIYVYVINTTSNCIIELKYWKSLQYLKVIYLLSKLMQ